MRTGRTQKSQVGCGGRLFPPQSALDVGHRQGIHGPQIHIEMSIAGASLRAYAVPNAVSEVAQSKLPRV